MLQAEVTALKTLVLTSTPASPNRELHPQLLSPSKAGPRKGHLRHKSTSSTLCPAVCPAAGHTLTPDKEGKEVRVMGGQQTQETEAVSGVSTPGGPIGRPDALQCDLERVLSSLGLGVLCLGGLGSLFVIRGLALRLWVQCVYPSHLPRGPASPSTPLQAVGGILGT